LPINMGSWSPDYKFRTFLTLTSHYQRETKVKVIERTKGLSKVNLLIWKAIRATLESDFRIWIQVRFRFIVYAVHLFLIIQHEHNFYMFRNARSNKWYQSLVCVELLRKYAIYVCVRLAARRLPVFYLNQRCHGNAGARIKLAARRLPVNIKIKKTSPCAGGRKTSTGSPLAASEAKI